MYEYRAHLVKVVDGDTVDVDIDLGFGVWLKDERVRIMGIDTPKKCILKTVAAKDGEDMKGKFGRILGDFIVDDKLVTEIMIDEGHAVKYHGQNKADVDGAHLANRNRLMHEGVVPAADVQAAEKEMEKE
jgi:micrococcal nuclease